MTLARYLAVCYSVTVLCMVLPDAVADWWWEWRGSA